MKISELREYLNRLHPDYDDCIVGMHKDIAFYALNVENPMVPTGYYNTEKVTFELRFSQNMVIAF